MCKDKNPKECPSWKVNGFCAKTSEWYGFMKDNCQKSCQFCGGEKIQGDTVVYDMTGSKQGKILQGASIALFIDTAMQSD